MQRTSRSSFHGVGERLSSVQVSHRTGSVVSRSWQEHAKQNLLGFIDIYRAYAANSQDVIALLQPVLSPFLVLCKKDQISFPVPSVSWRNRMDMSVLVWHYCRNIVVSSSHASRKVILEAQIIIIIHPSILWNLGPSHQLYWS